MATTTNSNNDTSLYNESILALLITISAVVIFILIFILFFVNNPNMFIRLENGPPVSSHHSVHTPSKKSFSYK